MFSLPPEPRRGFLLRRRRDAFVSNRSRADPLVILAPPPDRDGGVQTRRSSARSAPRGASRVSSPSPNAPERPSRATAASSPRDATSPRPEPRAREGSSEIHRVDEGTSDETPSDETPRASPSGRTSGRQRRRGAVPVPVPRRRRRRRRSARRREPVEPPRVERRLPGRRGTGFEPTRSRSPRPRRWQWRWRRRRRWRRNVDRWTPRRMGNARADSPRGVRRRAGSRGGGDPRRVGRIRGWVRRARRDQRVGIRGHVGGASNERCAVDSRRLGGFRGKRARSGNGRGARDAGGPVSGTRRVSTGGAGVGASIGPAGAAVLVAKDVGPPSFLMPKVLFTSRPNFPMAPTGGASWCSLGRLPGLRARSDVERIHGRGTCESSRTHRPAAKDVRCDDVENSRREAHDTCASVRFGVARNATRI